MNMERPNFVRKTFPVNSDNPGKTHRLPETLIASRRTLRTGSIIITNKQPPRNSDHFKLEKTEIIVQERRGKERKVKAWKVSPLVRTPLTPIDSIQGGGTSKEAFRRAKQKRRRYVLSHKKSHKNHNGK